MKQSFLKLTGKKFIAATFISTSLLFASFSTNAATIAKNNIEIISGEKTNIHFAGSTSDALIFNVNINNEKGDNFILSIRNNSGDVLFSKSFNDVNFSKNFKLLRSGVDTDRYTFTITSSNKALEDTYVVSATPRTVEDVAINKL